MNSSGGLVISSLTKTSLVCPFLLSGRTLKVHSYTPDDVPVNLIRMPGQFSASKNRPSSFSCPDPSRSSRQTGP